MNPVIFTWNIGRDSSSFRFALFSGTSFSLSLMEMMDFEYAEWLKDRKQVEEKVEVFFK